MDSKDTLLHSIKEISSLSLAARMSTESIYPTSSFSIFQLRRGPNPKCAVLSRGAGLAMRR